jgi:hypothetical protein
MFTGGRSSGGTLSSPITRPFGSWSASTDSSLGMAIPPFSSPADSSYQPPIVNGAPSWVRWSPSKAASFTGCDSATVRPAQSPITVCTGAASAANARVTTSAVRW